MERRRNNIETSPSPFPSAVSPTREVDDLSQMWTLPGVCYSAKVDGPRPYVPRYLCQFGLSLCNV